MSHTHPPDIHGLWPALLLPVSVLANLTRRAIAHAHARRGQGVDLVHFGVLVVLNMMIGLIHPPFGMLLFVTKALTGIPIGEMMKEGWPFLVMLLALLLAMTCFPQIVLWLPQTMGYGGK